MGVFTKKAGAPFAPLGMEELQVIGSHAHATRAQFRERLPTFAYNAHSIKLLSDAINAGREAGGTDQQQVVQRFGAFLGSAMIAAHPDLRGRWVRVGVDLGIAFQRGSECRLAFPMRQVRRQLDEGEAASIVGLYLDTRRLVLAPEA